MALKYIKGKIGQVRNTARILVALEGSFKTVFTLCCVIPISFILDYFLHFPYNIRLFLLIAYISVIFYVFLKSFLLPFIQKITDEQIALKVEKENPDLKDRLISALQFSRLLDTPEYQDSRELTLRVIDETEDLSRKINFLKVLNFKRVFILALLPIASVMIIWHLQSYLPKLSKIWWNRNVLLKQNAWPRKTTVFVIKDEISIAKDKEVAVTITTDRKNIENATLWYKHGNFWNREFLTPAENGYTTKIPALDSNTIVYVEIDDIISSVYRLRIRENIEEENKIHFELPDNKVVMSKGERLSIKILADGKIPSEVNVHFRKIGTDDWNVELAGHQGEGVFKYTFPPLIDDMEFFLEGNDDVDQIPVYQVNVLNPPSVVGVFLWYEYPAYTGIEPTPSNEPITQGNVKALQGTNIRLLVKANIPIAKAQITFPEKDQSLMPNKNLVFETEDKTILSTSFTVKADSRYEISLEGENGLMSSSPVSYYIRMDRDARPYVKGFFIDSISQQKITTIKQRIYMLGSATIPIEIELEDDYGVATGALQQKTNKEENWKQKPLALEEVEGTKKMNSFYNIELNKIKTIDEGRQTARELAPGDVVSCKFIAQDNNNISGPGSKETESFAIEIVEKADLLKRVNEKLLNVKNDLSRTLEIQIDKKEALIDFVSISSNVETGDLVKIHQLHFSQKSISRQVFDISEEVRYIMWTAANNSMWDVLTTNKISGVNNKALSIANEEKAGVFTGKSSEATENILQAYKIIMQESAKGQELLEKAISKQTDIISMLEEMIESLAQWEDFHVEDDLKRLMEETQKQQEIIKKWAQ